MKRLIRGLITILLLLGVLSGCSEEIPQGPVTYPRPTFTPGTLESDLLVAEPGNFVRCANSNDLRFAEIETGYYMVYFGYMYYADRTNLDAWYLVCADPDCPHDLKGCTAAMGANGIYIEGDRLWMTDTDGPNRRHAGDDGMYLVSGALNGTDLRWEYAFDEAKENMRGSCWHYSAYPGGFFFAADFLQPDGSFRGVIYLVDKETGPRKVFERIHQEQIAYFAESLLGKETMHGDLSIFSHGFSEDWLFGEVLCWFRDGEPTFSNISKVSTAGAYLSGNILRYFQPGDGYYDLNLLTGEKIALAQPQLENSAAQIMQPNCIIESTLLNPESQADTKQMRLFDGQQWHTVTLPKEIESTPETPLEVAAVTSDRIVFRIRTSYWDASASRTRESVTFYQIKLGADSYVLEYMGVNLLNQGIKESWSYGY